MTVRRFVLLLVALLVMPPYVARAQPAPEPEPFRIGFVSNVGGDNREIFTVDSDNGNRTNLTNNERAQNGPAFSPDGTRLAFTDDDHVMIADADGTNPRRLTTEPLPQAQPAWSPDGTMIALVTYHPNGEDYRSVVQVVRVADGVKVGEIPIPAHLRGDDSQPDWSPDGRTIAITRRAVAFTPPPPQIETPTTDRPSRPGGSFELEQVVKTQRVPPKPDIVLLIDTSGSMDYELASVKRTLGKIIEEIKEVQPETRFGLASYAGWENGENMFKPHSPLTDAIGDAVEKIEIVPDETSHEVWAHALIKTATDTFEFREDSSRVVVLIGDEGTVEHKPQESDTVDNAIAALNAKNIRVVGVDSGDLDDERKQATKVTERTKGTLKAFEDNGSEEISRAILEGITDLPVTVTPVSTCDNGLSVELDPNGPVTGPSGRHVKFAERFTVSDNARPGSTLRCTIEFRLNNEPKPRPDYTQTVTVRVNEVGQPIVIVDDVQVAADGNGAVVRYSASAADREGRPLTPVCTPPSGSRFPAGVTTVRCTATDSEGTTGSDTATITVTTTDPDDYSKIWLVSPDGSTQTDLSARLIEPCVGENDSDPAWSPDGTRIAFTQDERICTAAPDGTNARRVVERSETLPWPSFPAWLPDGTRIVFEATRSEADPDLYRVQVQGGTPELLSRNAGQPAIQKLPRIAVTAIAAPAEIAFGGTTTLEFTVTNSGFAPAPVTLAVTLPAGLRTAAPIGGDLGRIAVGETRVIRGEVTGVVAGDHVVTATAGAARAEVTVKVAEEIKPPDTPGSLSLAVGASPQPGFVGGDAVTVTYKLRNNSGTPMTNVRLIASAFGCQPECVVGTVAPGAEAEVRFTIPATQPIDQDLAGVLVATGPDTDALDNVATTRIVIKQPTLVSDAAAGPLGGVVSVQGKDFPPNARIRLAWVPGISETPGEVVAVNGTFTAQMLVFDNDAEGIRQAVATSVSGTRFGEVRSPDFLALPSTVQPADFVGR